MQSVDGLIIGAGPAGLTAAIYLARFHRNVLVADGGRSRAAMIPVSHNYPGFPEGVSGNDLLARLREQATRYGARILEGMVTKLDKQDDVFVATVNDESITAKKVLLATGVHDGHPELETWSEAVANGSIRLCPICDGYDVTDQNIGIISSTNTSLDHSRFLRTYSKNITLFCAPSSSELPDDIKSQLSESNITVSDETIEHILVSEKPTLKTNAGKEYIFDTLYVMLGESKGLELATNLGAQSKSSGQLMLNEHQETTVSGLYAAGDVVNSLHQISVAVGHAAVAATDMHNKLARNFR